MVTNDRESTSSDPTHPKVGDVTWDNSIVRGLGFLASAIAARDLTVAVSDTKVTYTDGERIYVDRNSTRADARDAVAVHAALLAGGAFERSIVLRLSVHRSMVGARYLALEAARVAHGFDAILPHATVIRVEALSALARSRSCDESLRRALSRETIPSPPPWIGSLRTRRLLRAHADLGGSPTDLDVDALTHLEEQPELSEADEEESEESKIMRRLSAPGVSNPIARAIQKLLDTRRRTESTTQAGGSELSVARQRIARVGQRGNATLLNRALTALFESAPDEGTRYPEWNVKKQTYRPDWCLVSHHDPAHRETEAPQVAADTLRRAAARVGLERTQHLRQSEGDTLDLSALVDHAVDRRLGDLGDPRIYSASRHTRRDLSVLVLLDSSGSTAEGSEGHTVFELERRLAQDLTESLENLGDHVATYGFYSQGKDSVRFLRVKEFQERFDTSARRRLQSIEPAGFTRFGAAIRHAGHLLQSQALSRNMIVIYIGDGLPYDDGYEDGYARADSHSAIQETILRGIGVVGLAIRSSTEPAVVQEIWSTAPFRVVTDTHDARKYLRAMLLDALRRTRTNGRRRELASAEHHHHMQALLTARRGTTNSYV